MKDWDNVLSEGMACGLSVIGSKVISNVDLVRPREAGPLFALERLAAFESSLSSVLV